MKTIFDAMNKLGSISTQFNEYDYPTAVALICMCVEEYCLEHKLNATEVFEDMLRANLETTSVLGEYK